MLAVEVVQVVLIAGGRRYALGWRPAGSLLAGRACCSCSARRPSRALGLLLAGTLRAEATLAVANGIYLLLLAVGGVVYAADRLPGAARRRSSRCCRPRALGQGLRDVLLDGGPFPWGQAGVLLVWGAGAAWAASRTFRWR